MADTIKTNLGPVTAYADAKAHGYTGTREEFGQLLAGAAGNLQDAVAAKEGAEAAKQAAETAQQAAAENQKNAETQAANAKASADSAAGQAAVAKEGAAGAENSASAAQESETNAGLSATAAANAEAAAKQAQQAAETAKTDAEAAKTAAGNSVDAAAASAADAKKTLESIPADYSTLSRKVDKNTSGISELKEENEYIKNASLSYELLSADSYTYVEGKNVGFDVQKSILTHNPDTYAAYAEIDVKYGDKYLVYCGGKKSDSVNYPIVMLAFSTDGNMYLEPTKYGYDPFCGVTETVNIRIKSYEVVVPNGATKMYVGTSAKGSMPIIILKNSIYKPAKYNGILGKFENNSSKSYGINDLEFLLKTAQRHFFDINKMCYEILPNEKMFGKNSNIYPKTDVQNPVDIASDSAKIRFGYWGNDTAETYLSISAVNPFRVYEVDFKDIVANGTTCKCYINFRNPNGGSYSLDMNLKTGSVYFNTVTVTVTTGIDITKGNFTVRLYIMRSSVALYFIDSQTGCEYIGTFDISNKADMCNPDVYEKYTLCLGAVLSANSKFEITGIRSYITCGCAQADIRLLKTFDCKPIISRGKAYLAMSCRGYSEGHGESYCGIFSFDLNTLQFELTGQIFTLLNGVEAPCVGTSIIFDENTGLWHLYYSDRHGVTSKDPRFGKTVFTNEKFSHTLTDKTLYDWLEDPDVYYNKNMNRYYMVVSVKEIDSSVQYPYSVAFLESNNINGPFSLLSKTNNTLGGTGTSWTLINDKLFATSGTLTDGIAVFDGNTYTKLSDIKLDKTYGGFRSWGCIVPIFDGQKTKYALITFDRNRGYGTFSYGNVFVYLSKEANEGMDYTKIYHTMLID